MPEGPAEKPRIAALQHPDDEALALLQPLILQRLINGVGGDCPGKTELHPDILQLPDLRVVVEFEPQSRHEGEIQQVPADYPVIELARVIRGDAMARQSERDVTLFDSVGFALEDYSALRFLHSLLQEQALGRRELDLIPQLDDPKDLFGGTLGVGKVSARSRARRTA